MKKLALAIMIMVMGLSFVSCGDSGNTGSNETSAPEQTESQDTNIILTKGNPNKLKRSDYETDDDFETAISEQYDEIEGYAVTSDAVVGEDIPAGTYYVYNRINWPQITINEGEEDEDLVNLSSGDLCTLKDGQKINCTDPCKFEPVQ